MTPGVDQLLDKLKSSVSADRYAVAQAGIVDLFERALSLQPRGRVFVTTGDIPAMWLRDSTWQMRPLISATHDPETADLVVGVSRQQVDFLLLDPYANAFNPTASGNCWHKDFSDQSPWVFERKFELDSWAAVLDLPLRLWEVSGNDSGFTDSFMDAVGLLIELARREQRHDINSYRFLRADAPEHDFLSNDGYGAPFTYTGLIWTAFRPSDDACVLPFHIPSNAYFAAVLRRLARIPRLSEDLRIAVQQLSDDIAFAIAKYGVSEAGYAYEVDGQGNAVLDDDANIPSLLSLPYLGHCDVRDPLYLKTRDRVLSSQNRWFMSGRFADGIGSPHTPQNHVWPLAIAMAALCSPSTVDVEAALQVLTNTTGGTGRMHESFSVNDPTLFTREWFSWADMTFVHLLMRSAGLDVR